MKVISRAELKWMESMLKGGKTYSYVASKTGHSIDRIREAQCDKRIKEAKAKSDYMKKWHAEHPKAPKAPKPELVKVPKIQLSFKVKLSTLESIKSLAAKRGILQYQLMEQLVDRAVAVEMGALPKVIVGETSGDDGEGARG